MKLLLIAKIVLVSNFVSDNAIALVAVNNPTTTSSCNWLSTENNPIFALELSHGQLEVSAQTLLGFAYSDPGFSEYINPLLILSGNPQEIYDETGGEVFKVINDCYAKLPGYNYTWKGIGDDGAIIARAAAEKATASNFSTAETQFQKTFQIMDKNTLVEFLVNGEIVSVANGNGHDITFQGNLTKRVASSPEFVLFQGYLYVYLPESGGLVNFDGVVQVCNGTASESVGIGGILTTDVVVPPNQGLLDPAGVESFLVLPTISPTLMAETIINEGTDDQIVIFVGNDKKVLDAAVIVGFENADPNFKAYFDFVSLGTGSDITESTNEAYNVLSNCIINTSK